MKITGWKIKGKRPTEKKYVLIAAPHTSNWDFVHMMAIAFVLGLKISWMGKHTLFQGAFGWFMKKMGGISVDRRGKNSLVTQLAEEFNKAESLVLVIPAAGTRGKRDYWKSGFYHIAREAGVPVVPGFLDYSKKEGGFGDPIPLTGDVRSDMDKIRDFYKDLQGKFPDQKSTIRLKMEDEEETSS